MANITGYGAPTDITKGAVGDIYTNASNGVEYECVGVQQVKTDEVTEYYSWVRITPASSTESAVSPTVDVTAIDGGHRVTVTDVNGEKIFDVMDGVKGPKGDTGATGAAGKDGEDGHTPVKGTDYFTDADKAEIVEAVVAEISAGETA